MNNSINNFKNDNLPFHQSININIFRLHQRLLKSFNDAAISPRRLGESILEESLYLGTLE